MSFSSKEQPAEVDLSKTVRLPDLVAHYDLCCNGDQNPNCAFPTLSGKLLHYLITSRVKKTRNPECCYCHSYSPHPTLHVSLACSWAGVASTQAFSWHVWPQTAPHQLIQPLMPVPACSTLGRLSKQLPLLLELPKSKWDQCLSGKHFMAGVKNASERAFRPDETLNREQIIF